MTQVHNYMKKPIQVEAMLFEGGEENAKEILAWIRDNGGAATYQPYIPAQRLLSNDPNMAPLEIAGKPEGIIVNPPLLDTRYSLISNFAKPGDYVVLESDSTFTVFSVEDLHNDYVYLD